jgi:predicted component of type VI protein secretion system
MKKEEYEKAKQEAKDAQDKVRAYDGLMSERNAAHQLRQAILTGETLMRAVRECDEMSIPASYLLDRLLDARRQEFNELLTGYVNQLIADLDVRIEAL